MSITDELREYADRFKNSHDAWSGIGDDLTAIADRIDAEYQKALDEWKAKHGQMWLKGYAECHAELLEGNETLASDLESCGWIRLPKDADGEYIHFGDVLDQFGTPMTVYAMSDPDPDQGDCMLELITDGISDSTWVRARKMRHYHAPTVEDVLREMHMKLDEVTALYVGEAIDSDERDRDEARIFAEYAKRLTLAEGEDA